MKPFNLQRALAGDPILIRSDKSSPWYSDAWVIGETKKGRPIIEWPDGDARAISNVEERLRMAPKKRTVFVNLYPHESLSRIGSYTTWNTAEKAEEAAKGERSLVVAVPIEIEE
ncbi:hypothetical protein [Paraburkholderia fungorum]|nr:hypothetical protein [Paraburkholderia fungorum]